MLLIIIGLVMAFDDNSWCIGNMNKEDLKSLLIVSTIGLIDIVITSTIVYLLLK